MSEMGATEVGGYAAVVIAAVGVIGKSIQWVWNAATGVQKSRAAKLQIWHDELQAREAAVNVRIDTEMASLRSEIDSVKTQVDKWRRGFGIVAAELYRQDPTNQALLEAREILQPDFPLHLPTH